MTILNRKNDEDMLLSPLAFELSNTIEYLQHEGRYLDNRVDSERDEDTGLRIVEELTTILRNHTKIEKLTFVLDDERRDNAFIRIIPIDDSNPLMERNSHLSKNNESKMNGKEGLKKLLERYREHENNKFEVGVIDLDNHRVGGFFKYLDTTLLAISTSWLMPDVNGKYIDPQSVVGVILHELGHLFSYLIAFNHIVYTDQVLQGFSNELTNTEDHESKVVIADKYTDQVYSKEYLGDMIRGDNKNSLRLMVSTVCLNRQMRSELGADAYNNRGFEAVADNFVLKNGLHLPFAKALDRLYQLDTRKESDNEMFDYFVELTNGITKHGVVPLKELMRNQPFKIYDENFNRIRKIKLDLNMRLRSSKLSQGIAKKLLKDSEELDVLFNKYKVDKPSFYENLQEIVNDKAGLRYFKEKENIEILENLAANDLYRLAKKLQTL